MRNARTGMRWVAAALAVGCGLGSAVAGDGATADPRVKAWLDQAAIKYELGDQSRFQMVFQVAGNRTQAVFVNSATEEYGVLEIREIWSVATVAGREGFRPETLKAMLTETQTKKLGAWSVLTRPEGEAAVFSVKLPAEASADQLKSAVQAVLETADEFERKLTSRDDF